MSVSAMAAEALGACPFCGHEQSRGRYCGGCGAFVYQWMPGSAEREEIKREIRRGWQLPEHRPCNRSMPSNVELT